MSGFTPILAENIDGWLFGALLFFSGIGASILALIGLVPAWRGKLWITLAMLPPAAALGIGTTCWFIWGCIHDGVQEDDTLMDDFIKPWLFLSGLPLIAAIATGLILCFKLRRKTASNLPPQPTINV